MDHMQQRHVLNYAKLMIENSLSEVQEDVLYVSGKGISVEHVDQTYDVNVAMADTIVAFVLKEGTLILKEATIHLAT
jgi:hypothetical protein